MKLKHKFTSLQLWFLNWTGWATTPAIDTTEPSTQCTPDNPKLREVFKPPASLVEIIDKHEASIQTTRAEYPSGHPHRPAYPHVLLGKRWIHDLFNITQRYTSNDMVSSHDYLNNHELSRDLLVIMMKAYTGNGYFPVSTKLFIARPAADAIVKFQLGLFTRATSLKKRVHAKTPLTPTYGFNCSRELYDKLMVGE